MGALEFLVGTWRFAPVRIMLVPFSGVKYCVVSARFVQSLLQNSLHRWLLKKEQTLTP